MKLRHIQAHSMANDIPDHIIEEIRNLCEKMQESLISVAQNNGLSPAIFLAALNLTHAVFIRELIVDDQEELIKVTFLEAEALILNVEFMEKIPKFD